MISFILERAYKPGLLGKYVNILNIVDNFTDFHSLKIRDVTITLAYDMNYHPPKVSSEEFHLHSLVDGITSFTNSTVNFEVARFQI